MLIAEISEPQEFLEVSDMWSNEMRRAEIRRTVTRMLGTHMLRFECASTLQFGNLYVELRSRATADHVRKMNWLMF